MLHASLKNIRASRSGHFTEAILEVDDGTQGLTADQIAPRNSHGELLVEALASCERLSTPPAGNLPVFARRKLENRTRPFTIL